jgi:hypothetical protein
MNIVYYYLGNHGGDWDTLKEILKPETLERHNVDINKIYKFDESTPVLIEAIKCNLPLEQVLYMIKMGADVKLTDHRNKNIFHWAEKLQYYKSEQELCTLID